MAKKELNHVKVVDNEIGEYEYYFNGTPKEATLGHSTLVAINSIGLNQLQAHGIEAYDHSAVNEVVQNALTEYLKTHFKAGEDYQFPDAGIGSRGPLWRTSEEREGKEVYLEVDGEWEQYLPRQEYYDNKYGTDEEEEEEQTAKPKKVKQPSVVSKVKTPKKMSITKPQTETEEETEEIDDELRQDDIQVVAEALRSGKGDDIIRNAMMEQRGNKKYVNEVLAEANKLVEAEEKKKPKKVSALNL